MKKSYDKNKTGRSLDKYDKVRKSQSRFCTKEIYASEMGILWEEHVYWGDPADTANFCQAFNKVWH